MVWWAPPPRSRTPLCLQPSGARPRLRRRLMLSAAARSWRPCSRRWTPARPSSCSSGRHGPARRRRWVVAGRGGAEGWRSRRGWQLARVMAPAKMHKHYLAWRRSNMKHGQQWSQWLSGLHSVACHQGRCYMQPAGHTCRSQSLTTSTTPPVLRLWS
jgi:hypothetical protein